MRSTTQPPAYHRCLARRAPLLRDSHGGTALFYAASFNDIEMLGVLIGARADVNLTSTRTTKGGSPAGMAPLGVAAAYGHLEAIRALVAAGAHVNASTTDLILGFQPLHLAMLMSCFVFNMLCVCVLVLALPQHRNIS